MLVVTGLLCIATGIILDVIARNSRKAFIIESNKFATLHREYH